MDLLNKVNGADIGHSSYFSLYKILLTSLTSLITNYRSEADLIEVDAEVNVNGIEWQ